MPALMMTLGASYRLEGKSGAREVAAREFYQGAYFTALEPGETPDRDLASRCRRPVTATPTRN